MNALHFYIHNSLVRKIRQTATLYSAFVSNKSFVDTKLNSFKRHRTTLTRQHYLYMFEKDQESDRSLKIGTNNVKILIKNGSLVR